MCITIPACKASQQPTVSNQNLIKKTTRALFSRGLYLVSVLHEITENIIRIQNPTVTVFHMVSSNQKMSFLENNICKSATDMKPAIPVLILVGANTVKHHISILFSTM